VNGEKGIEACLRRELFGESSTNLNEERFMKTFNRHLMETETDHIQNSGGKKMKAKELFLGLVVLSVLWFAASATAGVPQMINYQGVLTDTNGCPVEDNDYTMIFRLYDAATSGNLLWSETHDAVSTTQGNLNVLLGITTPIPDSVFLCDSVWLAVKVGNDAEMTPRQRIASVGYAFGAGMVMFDYESAWTGIDTDDYEDFTHNLGGDPSKYIVFLYGKSTSGYIHQKNYGTNYIVGGWRGCEWGRLTSTSIRVWRGNNDDSMANDADWKYVKVRILKNQ
jgi:hypothetical protein